MRNVRLWARELGVEHSAVIEEVRDDPDVDGVVVAVRPTKGNGIVAGTVSGAHPGTTRARDGADGGRWMRAR